MTIARTLGAALAAAVLIPGTAAAAEKPVPCDNLPAIADATDARLGFAGNYTPAAAGAHQEIKSFFLRNDPRGTSRVLTANLVVADLLEQPPAGSAGTIYRLIYTTDDGVRRYFDVSISSVFGVTFNRGHFDPTLVSDGAGVGRLFPGKDGVIQVELATGRTATTKPIDGITWNASEDRVVVLAQSDIVPNSGGTFYGGATCDGPPPAAAAKKAASARRVVRAAKRRR